MSNTDKILGDFHVPKYPELHPPDSIGNQQVWNDGQQVGAFEFVRNAETESLDVRFDRSKNK